jgi:uncharacterized protein YjdB
MKMQRLRVGFAARSPRWSGWVGVLCLGVAVGCSDVADTAHADDEIAAATTESMPTRISITPKYDTIAPGESATLVARNQVGTPTSLVTWRSSDPTIVTVSSTGQISGVRTGRAVVEARTLGKNAADWAMVYVMETAGGPAPVPSGDVAAISIMPTSAAMTTGQMLQFEARAYDSADQRLSGVTFTWTSSNPTVATVSATGLVTARSAGGAMVTASAGGKSISAPVTVTGGTQPETPVLSSVTLSPGQASGPPGSTVQLNAQALDQNGNVMSGVTFTWSSSNTSVATVSSSGFVTGVNPGTATVTASAGGHSASSAINVTEPTVTPVITTLSVSPGQASGPPGSTVQLGAEARDQNGNVMSGVTFTWTSSNPSVATVNAAGFVTAVAAGSATVTAAAGGQSGSSAITVTQPSTPTVASVAVSPSQASGPPGSTVQLGAQAHDQNGNVMTGVTFTWTSSNPSVATVSASGFVTAVSAGNATVTASADGRSGSSAITVTQPTPVVTTVAVSPAVTSVVRGNTVQLSAQARDQNGNVMSGVTFTWTSTNNSVATVSSAGLVTGMAAGNASITATASGRSASSAVTVTEPTQPPPSGRSYVFTSDFSTSQGTSLEAVTDGGRWNISAVTPETVRIIPSAGLDFPTANVLQMIATSERQGFGIIRKTGMPIPVVGEIRAYRWYIRMLQRDTLIDYQTHPIQDGNNASVTNWMFIVYNGGSAGIPAGRWQPQFWPDGDPVYNNRRWFGPILNKNETYRFELQIHRTGVSTFQMHIRIYNSAGTLIASDADFHNINNVARLSSNPTFTFPNIAWLDGLNAGNNGITNLPPNSNFTYAYEGGFAVCSGDWCGPYVPGEGR